MARERGAGEVGLPLAQSVENGAVILIRPGLPVAPPRGEEEARTGRLQVVDGSQEAGHPAGGEDQPVKVTVRRLPVADGAGTVAVACNLFCFLKNCPCDIGRGVAQSEEHPLSAWAIASAEQACTT